VNVCPHCGYGSEVPGPCPNCNTPIQLTIAYATKPQSFADLIAQQKDIIKQQANLIEEYEERLASARRALTQADVPEQSPDGKRALALSERIEILAQAVREVIMDWNDNEYGYMKRTDAEVTSSARSYITQAIQRLMGV
jgi:hypothetical protein